MIMGLPALMKSKNLLVPYDRNFVIDAASRKIKMILETNTEKSCLFFPENNKGYFLGFDYGRNKTFLGKIKEENLFPF